MAVTITAPQSAVVARGSVTLSWSPQYPQSAYEIMYRKKGDSAWSTFGQKSGSTTSVTMDLSKFVDFEEYHYRVVCYSNNATSGTTIYDGNDTSAAYSIIVVPANKVATMKTKYGSGMIEVPLYNDASMTDAISVKMGDGTVGRAPLRNADSALATNLKVHTAKGQKVALGNVPKFLGTNEYARAYIRQDIRQLYQKTYYNSGTYYGGTTPDGTYTRELRYYYAGYTPSGTYTGVYNKTYYAGSYTNYEYKYKSYHAGYVYYNNKYVKDHAYAARYYYNHPDYYYYNNSFRLYTAYQIYNVNKSSLSKYKWGNLKDPINDLLTYIYYYYSGIHVYGYQLFTMLCKNDNYYKYYTYSHTMNYYYTYGPLITSVKPAVLLYLTQDVPQNYTYTYMGYHFNNISVYNCHAASSYTEMLPTMPMNRSLIQYEYKTKVYYDYQKYSYSLGTYTKYYRYYYYSYANYKQYYSYYYYYYANYKYYYNWYYTGPFTSNYYMYTRSYLYK